MFFPQATPHWFPTAVLILTECKKTRNLPDIFRVSVCLNSWQKCACQPPVGRRRVPTCSVLMRPSTCRWMRGSLVGLVLSAIRLPSLTLYRSMGNILPTGTFLLLWHSIQVSTPEAFVMADNTSYLKRKNRYFSQFKVPFALYIWAKECVLYHYLSPIVRHLKVQFLWWRKKKKRSWTDGAPSHTHTPPESESVEICWPECWLLVAVAEDDEDGCCCCVVCWVAYSSAQTKQWRRLSTCLMALGEQWGRKKSVEKPLISLHSATVRPASS